MNRRPKLSLIVLSIVTIMALVFGLGPSTTLAASHREAPLIANDPTADITDFFMFRSYEPGHENNVVLIMDVIPFEEPSAGPNYYAFDPNVLYSFNIDNNGDGRADDVRFDVQFKNEFRGVNKDAGLFLSYIALPPITALDGPGSEGLGMRQKYTVTMVKNGHRTVLGDGLIAVPSNVGPRTMPNYDALAAQGIYDLGNGARVFAGQRDDPFFADLGAIFDTLNLRSPGTDMFSGFNVHAIALEVPLSLLGVNPVVSSKDHFDPKANGADDSASTSTNHATTHILGAYASTSRRNVTVLRRWSDGYEDDHTGQWVQIQRLANPLVNEAIIGTGDKDRWNTKDPSQEATFLDYYRNPRLATALNLVFGAGVPATPREDLVNILLKYGPNDPHYSELLRLNLDVPPTPLAQQNRLTILAGDNAGWPNGRRPIDDVIDISVKVIGGPNYATAGDGVDANDKPLPSTFPFLASPWDGRGRIHVNP